jgi:hypothetical protein
MPDDFVKALEFFLFGDPFFKLAWGILQDVAVPFSPLPHGLREMEGGAFGESLPSFVYQASNALQ